MLSMDFIFASLNGEFLNHIQWYAAFSFSTTGFFAAIAGIIPAIKIIAAKIICKTFFMSISKKILRDGRRKFLFMIWIFYEYAEKFTRR